MKGISDRRSSPREGDTHEEHFGMDAEGLQPQAGLEP
jgi:hypothetical protein